MMAQVELEVERALVAAGLDGHEGSVVAMVSGGADSLCLLDGLARLRQGRGVVGLHVNYGLRGEESDGDERRCREVCAGLGVELEVVRVEPPPKRENLMAWARRLRYGAAEELARRLEGTDGRSLVAVGHTADDQLETILYRLCVSPGRRALLGMARRRGRLVRPLLGLWRSQTRAYCEQRGLAWREDRTNLDLRFSRARVRQRLVPALVEVNPLAPRNVLESAELLRAEAQVLESLVERELDRGAAIPLERLAALEPALARLVVIELAERATGRYVPQAGRRVEELVALGRSLHGHGRPRSARLDLGRGAVALVERDMLRVVAERRHGRADPDGVS